MSLKARIDKPNGKVVVANQGGFNLNSKFYCQYDGCCAPMQLVLRANKFEYFRSKSKDAHKFTYCVRQDLHYDPDVYDESLFNMDEFARGLLNNINQIQLPRNGNGPLRQHITGNGNIPVKSIKTLYAAFLSLDINDNYNGYVVSDYLCCVENYERYRTGFVGFKIAELTYYHKVQGEHQIVFNYPYFDKTHNTCVLVTFHNDGDFWNIYNHYKKLREAENKLNPLIIAGNWYASDKEGIIAECDVFRSTQHSYIKN